MAEGGRRRSLVQTVIGFSAEHANALVDEDETFYGSGSDHSSSDSEGERPAPSATIADLPSDAEENLDEEAAPAQVLEPLAASGPRKEEAPTT